MVEDFENEEQLRNRERLQQKRTAAQFSDEVGERRKAALVRSALVNVDQLDLEEAAVARLLRGGRGGEIRLKVFLTLLWQAAAPTIEGDVEVYTVKVLQRELAEVIGVPDPWGRGKERVGDAVAWLERNDFLKRRYEKGGATTYVVMDDAGRGSFYSKPQGSKGAVNPYEMYIKLPEEFWTKGWVVDLDGAGVAALLALQDALPLRRRSTREAWISPGKWTARTTLSLPTRDKGFKNLKEIGAIDIDMKRGREDLGRKGQSRLPRNHYILIRELDGRRVDKVDW